ncbi:hypothetical protein SAMN06295888_11785 [Desulfonatronum zhilinae]|nr:hypothetical protein SAMN06295888_11785 [Desulfonatronum zhilinae]
MTQPIVTSIDIIDVVSACFEKIQNTRQAKAVFLFSETDHQVMGVETKKFSQMRKTYPDNFLGIYDSRATVDWLYEDVRYMFHKQEM